MKGTSLLCVAARHHQIKNLLKHTCIECAAPGRWDNPIILLLTSYGVTLHSPISTQEVAQCSKKARLHGEGWSLDWARLGWFNFHIFSLVLYQMEEGSRLATGVVFHSTYSPNLAQSHENHQVRCKRGRDIWPCHPATWEEGGGATCGATAKTRYIPSR